MKIKNDFFIIKQVLKLSTNEEKYHFAWCFVALPDRRMLGCVDFQARCHLE